MDREQKSWIGYIVTVLIVLALLLLNTATEDTLTLQLYPGSVVENDIEYQPHLSLPRGEYELHFNADGDFRLYTPDDGLISSGTSALTVVLEKDESELILRGTSGQVSQVVVTGKHAIFRDTIVIAMALAALLFYIGYIRFAGTVKFRRDGIYRAAGVPGELSEHAVYLVLIFVAILASYPLFSNYISYGHDLNFHLYRIEGIKDGLLSGQFPVRIDPTHNNGYGYVTASVYPSLFLYFPAFLRLLGVSAVTAYKCFLFAVNMATAFLVYICAKRLIASRYAGLLAAVVYTLSTWRSMNLIVRSAVGEGLAMTFFPVVILGLYEVLQGQKSRWWILALGCSAVFHSHVISCIFVVILGVVLCASFYKSLLEKERLLALGKAAVWTVLWNLWYLIPFMTYYLGQDLNIRHTAENTEYFSNAVFPAELFNVFNDQFGFSQLLPAGIRGNMSLSLGVGVSICLCAAVLYFILERRSRMKKHVFFGVLFGFSLFLLFMSSTLFPSELLQRWRLFNAVAGVVRMPWRYLSLASPALCLAGAAVTAHYLRNMREKGIVLGVISFVCAVAFVHFGSAYTTGFDVTLRKGQAVSTAYSAGWDDEYFLYGTDKNTLTAGRFVVSSEGIRILSYEKQGTNLQVWLTGVEKSGYVEVPLLYYLGYEAQDDRGETLELEPGTNNVLRVRVDAGVSGFQIRYAGLPSFKIACAVSLISWVGFAVYCGWYCRKKRIREAGAESA